jgi:hypothetical protein
MVVEDDGCVLHESKHSFKIAWLCFSLFMLGHFLQGFCE